MNSFERDVEYIDTLTKALEKMKDPRLTVKRTELGSIRARVVQALTGASCVATAGTEGLLTQFFKANPDLLRLLGAAFAERIIDYVSAMCDYYAGVKAERPLTEEEKQEGRKLQKIVELAKQMLRPGE